MAEEVDVQWETIADRHHRVRSTRVARLPTGEEAGRLISTADLRALIERDYEQLVVSLYLNLAPDEVVRRIRPHLNVFNSMRHREEESRRELIESQPRQHRDAVRSDLDETEELLNALEPGHAQRRHLQV